MLSKDMSQNNGANRVEETKAGWLRKRLVPLLAVLGVIGISVGLFVFVGSNPGMVERLGNLRYLGVFIASLLSSTTVILPVPGVLVVFPLVTNLNPILVAVAGSTGGIIGEVTGYVAGYGGQGMTGKGKLYRRVELWMKRWGVWTVFAFSFLPFLPFDVAGLVAGGLRYPLWKFMLIGYIGKTLKYIALVYAAFWGWKLLFPSFG